MQRREDSPCGKPHPYFVSLSFSLALGSSYCGSSSDFFFWSFNILNLISMFLKQIIKFALPSPSLPSQPPFPPSFTGSLLFCLNHRCALVQQYVRGSSVGTWAVAVASLKKTDSLQMPSFLSVKKPHTLPCYFQMSL